MIYKTLDITEAESIKDIDATWYIENAWREIDGKLQLIRIDWTEYELPNGLSWHMERFCQTIQNGGKAFGCFFDHTLIGYATINADLFGTQSKYALLEQLFISKDYRCQGIGRQLFLLCCKQAIQFGADKIYICSASAEDTIAFYKKIGCINAAEINDELQSQDPRDIQLEYCLIR